MSYFHRAAILLHGPTGCGKTTLARAIANETGVPLCQISAPSHVNLRELFSLASHQASPSILFFDDIDLLERPLLTPLISWLADSRHTRASGFVLVIAATNRPDSLDPALRRPRLFDREFPLGSLDHNARLQILSLLTRHRTVSGPLDLMEIAKSTPGFVGADLAVLTDQAGYLAIDRLLGASIVKLAKESADGGDLTEPLSPEEMEKLSITMADLEAAAKSVQPSFRRDGVFSIPDVKWEDVAGLDSLK